MDTSCAHEFKLKRFGFEDCEAKRFYSFKISTNRLVFVFYRLFTLLFIASWFVLGLIYRGERFYLFLSNWSMVYSLVYFALAFSTAVYGLTQQNISKKLPNDLVNHAFTEEEDSESVDPDNNINNNGRIQGHSKTRQNISDLKWFHKVTWFFHTVAIDTSLFVTILYWGTVYPTESLENRQPVIGLGKHAFNAGILVIDLLLANFPVRLLHTVYMIIACLVYSGFTIIMHATSLESAIYTITDYEKSPGIAAGIMAAACFISPWLLHGLVFGLFKLRELLFSSCRPRNPPDDE